MGQTRADGRWGRTIDAAAAACLGAAVAFAVGKLVAQGAVAWAAALAAGAVTMLAAHRLLARLAAPAAFAVPAFALEPIAPDAPDELLLSADDLYLAGDADALLLDDVLVQPGAGARVVRLFDAAAIPTAGELQRRIDRHLHRQPPPPVPDQTAALHEALAVLRRSLGAS